MTPVYFMTSNKYWPSMRIAAHLFRKYWSEDQWVGVAGFEPPPFELPEGFDFISLGDQADYPINRWSDGLYKLMDMIPYETFVLMLDDYWVIEPVKVDLVRRLTDYINQFPKILKIDLAGDRAGASPVRNLGTWAGMNLLLSDPASAYHMSLYIGMWRKELLRQLLVPGETPWDIEIEGTNRLREYGDEMLVVGTANQPVRITLGHRYGDHTITYTDELPEQDRKELIDLGYLSGEGG